MNERDVLNRSVYIALIGCLLFGILSFILKDISYVLGFVLGYLINVIVFILIIKMSEGILRFNLSAIVVAGVFMFKLMLYACGFILAIKTDLFHIIGVFVGYLVMKLTIYYEGYIHKGGE